VAYYEAEHLKGALDLMIRTRQRYPYDRILSHKFTLAEINEAFRQQEDGRVTRGAIVPTEPSADGPIRPGPRAC
jgi:hypothetical protein